MDLNTAEPLDTLTPLARRAIEQLGSSCTTVSSVISSRDQAVFTAIEEGLKRANEHAISNAQKVGGWNVCQLSVIVHNIFRIGLSY